MRFLRWLNPEIAIGVLVASALWTAVLGWQAAYAPTEIEKQECQAAAKNAGHKTEECKTLWERTTSDPVAFFTLVLAISTVGLWVATIALYVAGEKQFRLNSRLGLKQDARMRESIKLARDEFISTHRPKIILREAFTGSFLEGEPIKIFLQFANIGETAGLIAGSAVAVQIIATTEQLLLNPHADGRNDLGQIRLRPGTGHIVMVPGEMPQWNADRFIPKVFPNDVGGRTLVRAVIHVAGQIMYVDEAGIVRRTAFRRRLTPERQRFYRLPDEPDLDYSD